MSTITYASGNGAWGGWVLRGPRVLADPGAFTRAADGPLRAGLHTLGDRLKGDAARAYADVPRVRDGFTYETSTSPYWRLQLRQREPLFPVIEYPTRPHRISAHSAAGLHFYWARKGRWVRTLSVRHPGTAGRGAIDPLLLAAEAPFRALLDAVVTAGLDA